MVVEAVTGLQDDPRSKGPAETVNKETIKQLKISFDTSICINVHQILSLQGWKSELSQ